MTVAATPPTLGYSATTYRRILERFLAEGYKIVPVGEDAEAERVAYLRHDVDYGLPEAVAMAEVNHDLGVAGIFFLNPRTPHFNLLTSANQAAVRRLGVLGQTVGLHLNLDAGALPPDVLTFDMLVDLVERDWNLLENMIDVPLARVMSWHNPSILGDAYRDFIYANLPNMLNAYALESQGIVYRADSNHRFPVQTWLDMPKLGHKRVQVLFHPFQWMQTETFRMNEAVATAVCSMVRSLEAELRFNPFYARCFPNGFQSKALQALVQPLVSEP
jgi:hypothetical protein